MPSHLLLRPYWRHFTGHSYPCRRGRVAFPGSVRAVLRYFAVVMVIVATCHYQSAPNATVIEHHPHRRRSQD
jgi:hypothetical protein